MVLSFEVLFRGPKVCFKRQEENCCRTAPPTLYLGSCQLFSSLLNFVQLCIILEIEFSSVCFRLLKNYASEAPLLAHKWLFNCFPRKPLKRVFTEKFAVKLFFSWWRRKLFFLIDAFFPQLKEGEAFFHSLCKKTNLIIKFFSFAAISLSHTPATFRRFN